MSLSRRTALRLLGLSGLTIAGAAGSSGCSLLDGGTPEPRLLSSKTGLPKPYQTTLPITPVAEPVRTDAGVDYYELAVTPTEQRILPDLPTTVWGYAGQFPGPTFRVRGGRRIVVEQRNELPVPFATHLHGGRTPPDSDGYPTDLVRPNASRTYEYPLEQRAATLWYHDHRMDFTGPQVWRGLAGMFIVSDDEDDGLPLPHAERDIPLLICDRSFDADGSLLYPALDPELADRPGVREAYHGGVLGDVVLVNGAPWPRLAVDGARYRLRLLNASNARTFELTLDPPPSGGQPFVQIGSDGGLLARPRSLASLRIAPGERLDVVVDFGAYRPGTKVELRNAADEDGAAARVMRFDIGSRVPDDARVPARLSRIERLDPSKATVTRDFDFGIEDIGGHPTWVVNGKPFDTERTDARPELGATEIWRLKTDIAHPIHLHLAPFQVLSVDGEQRPTGVEWKDTIDVDVAQTVEILVRFDGYKGRYVLHCHNLEHEDMAMMSNFEVV